MAHDFKLADSISHQLRRVEQLASDRFAKLVGENSLTLRQYEVLTAANEKPGLSQSDLVVATGIDRSTLADMMNRMEKRGWIARVTSEKDARANAVTLTPAGLSSFHTAIQHARAADAAILDALSRPKAKAFEATLHKLVKAADAANAAAQRKAKKKLKAAAKEAKAAAALEARGVLKKQKKRKKDDAGRQPNT
jgi:DNA-binding MarR family transcriptional regulator